jgi:hypothetical protein
MRTVAWRLRPKGICEPHWNAGWCSAYPCRNGAFRDEKAEPCEAALLRRLHTDAVAARLRGRLSSRRSLPERPHLHLPSRARVVLSSYLATGWTILTTAHLIVSDPADGTFPRSLREQAAHGDDTMPRCYTKRLRSVGAGAFSLRAAPYALKKAHIQPLRTAATRQLIRG